MADHRRGSLAACTVAVALLLSCPAAAIDGEIVVDQTAVDAGGISPGDAPGYPVTISRRGKYKLTGDLAVPAGVSGFGAARWCRRSRASKQ